MNNLTDHILWPYDEDDPDRDIFGEADMMYSEFKLERDENKSK